ncbi:SPFH domain-containing protein [Methanospirillum hungatei]|jgi:regulator of protease activity HflC (stomatin/prohibitin superfamily)|uniref:SPFH domain-containing protein n=1 Tax=Methanospirillum hungatei TaxID=2203 RepID=UPI0009CECBFC|nr:SPFH domain-containing protein [Methanospirillum hungatei]MBP9008860.1 SPFH/Band 7/PHB domain protein [Methanospirillum sp.]MCA1915386.1 SPFH/Band 7/PHB domain protein [Methanospirillum hungatei]OQA58112.1 MAG: FtsH protease regulator HflK [Euryarchaeota archaeon ADurb.Bin294]HOW05241.1 SPFH domain-containing protein [Methanospirillum hungatei]
MAVFETLVTLFLVIVILIIFARGVIIVQPYEQGLQIRLGRYIGRMNPGFRWVIPLITQVVKLDLRTLVMDVPSQEVITKDNSPTNVDAIVYIRVVDPEKAFFEVSNYRMATVALAQTSLRGIIGDMELDEVLYNRESINTRLRDILDRETDQWGVKVERVEIKEVDPVGTVKQAMTEQTAAERERRAAILRADGEKRSAILKAEGLKKSMILEAEGERQSKILKAEGERLSQILRAQGESQGLRILALGSRSLDKRAITVLSFDALKTMANGQATKIIFPFEISSLIKQGAKYLGATESMDDKEVYDVPLDESLLGDIPTAERIMEVVRSIEDETRAIMKEDVSPDQSAGLTDVDEKKLIS